MIYLMCWDTWEGIMHAHEGRWRDNVEKIGKWVGKWGIHLEFLSNRGMLENKRSNRGITRNNPSNMSEEQVAHVIMRWEDELMKVYLILTRL